MREARTRDIKHRLQNFKFYKKGESYPATDWEESNEIDSEAEFDNNQSKKNFINTFSPSKTTEFKVNELKNDATY